MENDKLIERLEAYMSSQGHTAINRDMAKKLKVQRSDMVHLVPLLNEQGGVDGVTTRRYADRARLIASAIGNIRSRKNRILTPEDLKLPSGMSLDYSQSRALEFVTERAFGILSGGPGTGKTFLTTKIVEALAPRYDDVVIMTPTAVAAKVFNSYAAGMNLPKATTIHSRLGWIPGMHPTKIIDGRKLVIIDEASMLGDDVLFNVLVSLDLDKCTLILVGDPNQINSVEPGSVLSDLMAEGYGYTLRTVHRSAAGTGIPNLASAVLRGELYEKAETDSIRYLPLDTSLIPKSSVPGEQLVIYPVRDEKKFFFTVHQLNVIISGHSGGMEAGDRVIGKRNDRALSVVNGMLGTVTKVYNNFTLVTWDDGTFSALPLGQEGKYVEYGFATTCHKAQGSQVDRVILILDRRCRGAYSKELVYTAITRAKKEVWLMGDRAILADLESKIRYTSLRYFLGGQPEEQTILPVY